MSDLALGAIMVERHFEANNKVGEEHEVILHIGIPARANKPDGDWYCPYQITGISNNGVRVAFGIDSLQAFLLALEKARSELAFSQCVDELRLTWLEQDNWGLPKLDTSFG